MARFAHLPSYKTYGLPVSGICDVDSDALCSIQAEARCPFITFDVDELAGDPAVTVVDVTAPPATHRSLLEQLARHGKPVLLQKPLCVDRADMQPILALREGDLRLWLNLTGRYVSAWQKVRELIAEGAIGNPQLCTIVNRDWWDRAPGRWEHAVDNFIIHEMAIHHLDLCLFWFGLPTKLTARGGNHPGQRIKQCNWATVQLEFDSGLVVSLVEDWTMSEFAFASGHPFEEVVVNGAEGVIRATSCRVECSRTGENTVRMWHLPRPGQELSGEPLTVRWFPDSFGAAMLDFMGSLEDPDAARKDWEHVADLTELTFTVADALRSDHWLRFERKTMQKNGEPR